MALQDAGVGVDVLRSLLLRVDGGDGRQAVSRTNLPPQACAPMPSRSYRRGAHALAASPRAGRTEDILPLLRHEDLLHRAWAAIPLP